MPIVGYEASGGSIKSRTYYLEDDWDDNALSGRTDPESGPFFYQEVSNQPGDTLVGQYRPEWATVQAGFSASNGVLTWDASNGTAAEETQSNANAGEWKIDFQYTTNGGDADQIGLGALHQNSGDYNTNGYRVNPVTGNASYRLYDNVDSVNLIDSSWVDDTSLHTAAMVRDSDSNWEIFLDGTSKGTATDATNTEGNYIAVMAFDSQGGSTAELDNLQVK